jgi:uncharacterized protein involved in type VI secretion and phage assembly
LNAAQLRITHLTGIEKLSSISVYNITLIGVKKVDLCAFLKQPVSIIIKQYQQCRYIHGDIITAAIQLKKRSGYYHYQMIVKTLLWRLNQKNDCRIFHRKSILDICKIFLNENDILCYQFKLFKKHSTHAHQTQYQESALNFLNRLFNLSGIFYYHQHLKKNNQLVFSDSIEGYHFCERNIQFQPHGSFKPHIYYWRYQQQLFSTGNHLIRILAKSNLHTIAPGEVFALTDHPLKTINQDYVITKIWHIANDYSTLTALNSQGSNDYHNIIECTPLLNSYPVLNHVHLPKIYGVQTAKVVRTSSNTSHAHNINGQVKVLFPWDIRKSMSPFISIRQALADQSCGIQFFPKANDFVVVAFKHGDPNKPVILGSVYDTNQSLPFDHNTCGIKTHNGHTLFLSNKPNNEKVALTSTSILNTQTLAKHSICADYSFITTIQQGNQEIHAHTYQVNAYQSIHLRSNNGSIKIMPDKIIFTGSVLSFNS